MRPSRKPRYRILRIAPPNIHLQHNLSRELGISKALAQILINRGLNNIAEAKNFLDVKLEHLLDPYSFSDMHKAVGLIKRACEKKERVMVSGDYDVDGITSLALLKGTLKKMGLEAEHYLPHRVKEGYGLSKNILDFARRKKIKLLITVDCGMNNHEEIRELGRCGVETIVTDHHEPEHPHPPPAAAIINPKSKGCTYSYKHLAGVGVAYKLCQALTASKLAEDLDLVSLGTIADVVPLTGENRVIAKEGLLRLGATKRAGLKALIESSGIKNKKFTSTSVSFIIGPRLNASGRLDSAEVSLDLLMSKSREEASRLAEIIEGHNRQRRKIESQILAEAEAIINKEINFKEHKIIVIAKENWHEGVLGIVASKLVDRFYRPAIVISLKEGLCRGSARSIKNFHLFNALLECKQFLNTFGGHSHAAGLVISVDSIDEFRQNINAIAKEKLSLEDLLPSLDIDMELAFSELNEKMISELEALEPFGTGNSEPLFCTRNLRIKGQPQILSRDTLKLWVTDGNITHQAIGFGMAASSDNFTHANYFDLVYTLRMDNWLGESSILLEIRDIFFK